jgi:steroid delta-isomerase-like uncharacterized protein
MAVIDELCSDDFVFHGAVGEETHGLKAFKQREGDVFDAFPDLHIVIHDMIAEKDKVATRFTLTGTHRGEFSGIPPTNRKVTVWTISIDRIVGGKFVESWVRYDTLSLMQQLGVVPTPKKKE